MLFRSLAPFVRLSPLFGAVVANSLLFSVASLLSAFALRRRFPVISPLLVAFFVFGSVAFAHVFWAHPDLFLMSLTALALAASFLRGEGEGRGGLAGSRAGRFFLGNGRWLLIGAMIGVVGYCRPPYLAILLPILVSTRGRHGRRARGLLLSATAVVFLLAAAVNLRATGSWTAYGGERRGFMSYTGYPLVKEARDMVAAGKLGKIRKVVVEYPQGWLATRLELTGQKQAAWRTDPKRSGAAGCIGDIGTHAENLAEYITGLKIKELAADLTAFVSGRKLDDDGNVLLRFRGGAKGVLHSSQISVGEENNLNIRVYGERGSLEWHQNEPNTMLLKWPDQPMQVYRTGNGYLGAAAANAARTPPSHPEGYLEAFANIYVNFANHIRAKLDRRKLAKDDPALDYPKIKDAVRGMAFIEAVVKSSKNNARWTKPAK